jgi:hypothetical protein
MQYPKELQGKTWAGRVVREHDSKTIARWRLPDVPITVIRIQPAFFASVIHTEKVIDLKPLIGDICRRAALTVLRDEWQVLLIPAAGKYWLRSTHTGLLPVAGLWTTDNDVT